MRLTYDIHRDVVWLSSGGIRVEVDPGNVHDVVFWALFIKMELEG